MAHGHALLWNCWVVFAWGLLSKNTKEDERKKEREEEREKEGKGSKLEHPRGTSCFFFYVPNRAQCEKATFGFDAAEAVPLCFLPYEKKEAREAQISYSQP